MKAEVKTKPRQTIIGQVYETYNYEMFETLEGNRNPSKPHIAKLVESMKEVYLISPIIVNKDMAIIDGQHRFEAAKLLGLPIRYIIDKDADLRAVQLLNAKSKNWSADDFMECYVTLGNENYIRYKQFMQKYKLSHATAQALLSTFQYKGHKGFNSGLYEINRYEYGCKVADFAISLSDLYEGSRRRNFVAALSVLGQKKEFDFNKFRKKLEIQRNKMYDCAKTSQYIELIEDIYNYKSRKKVNLRL